MMMKKRDDQRLLCTCCFEEVFDTKAKVCPYCGCKHYYIAPIDGRIFDDVQMLNKKGYITYMCCEGHIDRQPYKNHVAIGASVSFTKKYDFDWGWDWHDSKVGNFYIYSRGKRIETPTKKLRNGDEWVKELTDFKEESLKMLHEGVMALPCIK